MSDANAGAALPPAPDLGFLNLRADAAHPTFAAAVAKCGLALPSAPCTFATAPERTAYWLGPDEWLIAMPAGQEAATEAQLRDALKGLRFSATDVTGAWIALDLTGAHARETLRKASPCDFHPQAFPPGRCVQTTFGKTSALIAAHTQETFRLMLRASYADYVRRWLATATEEHEHSTPPLGERPLTP